MLPSSLLALRQGRKTKPQPSTQETNKPELCRLSWLYNYLSSRRYILQAWWSTGKKLAATVMHLPAGNTLLSTDLADMCTSRPGCRRLPHQFLRYCCHQYRCIPLAQNLYRDGKGLNVDGAEGTLCMAIAAKSILPRSSVGTRRVTRLDSGQRSEPNSGCWPSSGMIVGSKGCKYPSGEVDAPPRRSGLPPWPLVIDRTATYRSAE